MTPCAECARTTDTLTDAARKMRDRDVGSLPVCGEDDRLYGVISDRDIVVKCLAEGRCPGATTVESCCETRPVTIGADDPIEQALRNMVDHHLRRLPVVDGDELVGMISQADIAKDLSDEQIDDLVEAITSVPADD